MSAFQPDQAMLENYIQHKLSPEHEEQVELWLMDNPGALEDIKLDLVFTNTINPSMASEKQSEKATNMSMFGWFLKPQFAAAMTLVIGTGIGFALGKQAQIDYTSSPVSITKRMLFETTRSTNSTGPDARITIDNDTTVVLLEFSVQPWIGSYQNFSAQLSIGDEQFRLNPELSWNDTIEVAINSSSIPSDEIVVELFGQDIATNESSLANYIIEVNQR